MLARHAAPSDDGKQAAPVQTLARRAQGRSIWGVLRGDVDNFGLRLRRVHSIEEHVPLSRALQAVLRGRAGSAVLAAGVLAQGQHHLFGRRRFRGLRVVGRADRAGARGAAAVPSLHRRESEGVSRAPEGKTISMAIALAPETYYPLAAVYEEAGRNLDLAKSADKDCIYLLGRILEWRHLNDAADLKDMVTRLIHEFRMSQAVPVSTAQFLPPGSVRRRDAGRAADVALPAPLQPHSERHARSRISETARASDQ